VRSGNVTGDHEERMTTRLARKFSGLFQFHHNRARKRIGETKAAAKILQSMPE